MEAGEWMLVSLIKKDKIYSVTLPLAVNGTYWVAKHIKMAKIEK